MSTFALSGATLIDGRGGSPLTERTVVVENGVITRIVPTSQYDASSGPEVLDVSGKWLLPGYINGNIHLLDGVMMMGVGGVEYLARYEGSFVKVIEEGAQLSLRNGVTTVFDTWDARDPVLEARDRINSGASQGSRIFAAGNIVGMGGPFSPDFNFNARQSISPTFANRIDALFSAGVGAELTLFQEKEVRARFRDYVQSGVDMVKVAISDHLTAHLDPVSMRTYHTFPEKWVRWMAEDTHAEGLPFLSHTLAVPALEIATDVEVDVMIHPTWTFNQVIPDELVRRIADRRIGVGIQPMTDDYSVKLLAHGNFWGALNSPEHQKNERNFIDAGANVMVATDAGCTSHDVLQDLGHDLWEDRPTTLGEDHFTWVKALQGRGLNAMGAIQALTHNVAEAYGKLDRIGTVEVGKVADLVLLNSDPLADTENLRDIAAIYKEGVAVDRSALPTQQIVTAPTGTPIPE
ncbi:amidohydrolase family protein [Rhodococcus pseudokoreensis]|uniref:Amidohydrolase family protein n=1 Tax=Rhodococcus pseudokoreensis TaxID=2811421 RepID=A0A974VYV7_9NOCA|nr:amidohydrolase family protein [Rhodococcus pseudokoreensis]QSE88138.1 amidohydrolase family protein [Rhodococcus pseudokoreensis]